MNEDEMMAIHGKFKDNAQIAFRVPTESDMHFVLRAWMTGFFGHGWSVMCRPAVYYLEQQNLIATIAQRPNARLIVAFNSENPSQLYGFVCGEPSVGDSALVMHWAYTKQVFRRLGLARAMLEQFGWEPGRIIIATHWTKRLYDNNGKFMKDHNIYCNPFILMQPDRTKHAPPDL